ncbi:hypothetical protein EYF80_002729 [Liparis tanakae]|uniref:Uncharacterized protein n=1 Tax=Liparis tanakae TaxID=230148 RepID=A0A4Z2JAW5_9TELE|nr:hypothetical protein EYF80_002729 [Liparis tanakae]
MDDCQQVRARLHRAPEARRRLTSHNYIHMKDTAGKKCHSRQTPKPLRQKSIIEITAADLSGPEPRCWCEAERGNRSSWLSWRF